MAIVEMPVFIRRENRSDIMSSTVISVQGSPLIAVHPCRHPIETTGSISAHGIILIDRTIVTTGSKRFGFAVGDEECGDTTVTT